MCNTHIMSDAEQTTDLDYFYQKLQSLTDPDDVRMLERQIELLEDAAVIYHEHRPPTRSLRVLVMKTEIPDVLVGQGLERDICTQGATVEELVRRFGYLLDFYKGEHPVTDENGKTVFATPNVIENIEPAPQSFFDQWDTKSGVDHITVEY